MSALPPAVLGVPGYVPDKDGSLERYYAALTRALRPRGVAVGWALPGPPVSSFAAAMGEAGAAIHVMPGARSGPLHAVRIARLVRRCRAACVLVGFPPGDFEACLGARLGGARVVIRRAELLVLAGRQGRRPSPRQRLRARVQTAGLSRIIAVSEAVRQEQLALGVPSAKVTVVENGVDLDLFRPAQADDCVRSLLGLDGCRIVLTVANMYDPIVKGLDDLIAAAAEVGRRFPEARFVIVGDGPYRPIFEAEAERAGVADRVIFAGLRDDVADILNAAELLVLSSLSEAGSLTILEAMAAGKAVVATRVGGNPEMVAHDETGLLVPPRAPQALAEAIGQCLADPDRTRAMGVAARAAAEKRFGLERMVDRTVEVLRECWAEAAGVEHCEMGRTTAPGSERDARS